MQQYSLVKNDDSREDDKRQTTGMNATKENVRGEKVASRKSNNPKVEIRKGATLRQSLM